MNRRKFLQLGATGGAVGLLAPGLLMPRRTRASFGENGPNKLLTIYMPGGWMPSFFFAPFQTAAEVGVHWPSYLAQPNEVTNLDGSGDARNAADGNFGRLRVPQVWDDAIMSNPASFSGTGGAFWPDVDPRRSYGYSWKHYGLAEDTCVVHGVDQQTADHYSGRKAALSGIAGARFSVPSMHCVAAHAALERGINRPLGAVTIKTNGPWGPTPSISHVGLPAHAAPTSMAGLASLTNNFSDETGAWDGLRHRDTVGVPGYGGGAATDVPLTRMDQHALERFRQFRGLSDESFYESLYDAHVGVSRKMALDLVTVLQATPGFEGDIPHWVQGTNPFQCQVGRVYGDTGNTWREQFDLVLKLFKADVCTSINVQCPAVNGEGFDIHGGGESNMTDLFNRTRSSVEVIGRLLGEMKATPMSNGNSLLDETLVVLVSEFGRSWPQISTSNGHWPFTSYVFCGGGIHGNRSIGGYDIHPTTPNNPTGVEVAVEGGMKHPTARDVARTVYRVLGVPDDTIEIFGGPSEILGVRAS